MYISVIGTGYLGATHAACLAELGFTVLGVDTDAAKVRALSQGAVPFSEPGLADLVERHVRTGRLRFTTELREAAAFAEVHFICVGTPQIRNGKAADLGGVFDVTRELGAHLTRDCLIVGKSTVPVGTAQALSSVLSALTPHGVSATIAWNPEFLREGHAVHDSLFPDRLVFGVSSQHAATVLRRIYARPIQQGAPVHVTDLATAELAKAAANAFLATKVSFINAVAELSDSAGADVVELADILGADARIGRRFLDAGIGFGGGCLPKDIRALAASAAELGAIPLADLLGHVDAINAAARKRTVDLVHTLLGTDLRGRRIGVLGAAFKPHSDDVRDSPALHVAGQLHHHGADVRVFDPEAANNARGAYPALSYVANTEAALADADLLLHLTEWPEFQQIDPHRASQLARGRVMIDGRNKLDRHRWRQAGWTVYGLGRGGRPACGEQPTPPATAPGSARQNPHQAAAAHDIWAGVSLGCG